MTLYLDTSALVKLYVLEADSRTVETAVASVDEVAIAVVGYTEGRAAFARRHREQLLDDQGHETATAALERDWPTFARLGVTDGMARLAGGLADRYGLRGFDAVHLAAALMLHREREEVMFLAYDNRLAEAAASLLPIYK